MPGSVTDPFMQGGTPPNDQYCPTGVLAEGKTLLAACMVYPGGRFVKPNHVYEGKPCEWYLKENKMVKSIWH